jgi:integrin alpha FG-GAP repeat containing protein 1
MGIPEIRCSKYGLTRKILGSGCNNQESCPLAHSLSLSQTLVRARLQLYLFSNSRIADRDGTIDMIFATCSSVSRSTGLGNDCYVNVAYNKQLPLCSSTTSSRFRNDQRLCRAPEELCIADPNFTFELGDRPGNDVRCQLCNRGVSPFLTHLQAFVRVSLKDLVPTSDGSTPQLLVLDTTYDPPLPVPLKIGDLNLDGFVDIVPIVATRPPGGGSKLAKTPKILGSVACRKGVAGCGSGGKGRRGWSVLGRDNNILEEFQDARGVVLIDIDEDVGSALPVVRR